MFQIIVVILMFLAKLLSEDDTELEALEESMLADGTYDWDDVGTAFTAFGESFVDSAPSLLEGAATFTGLKETGALTGIGIDPSGQDTPLNTVLNWLPYVALGVGAFVVVRLATRE